jgi:hypothetical protein
LRQTLHRRVIQAEVEDRVHHPWHRNPCARSHRDEQRIGGVAKFLADGRFDMGQGGSNGISQTIREIGAIPQIRNAFFGGNGEARRHRQANAGHFGKVGALAPSDGLVLLARVGVVGIAPENIDRLQCHGSSRKYREVYKGYTV